MKVFEECLRKTNGATTLFYANHPAQHFYGRHPKGWYSATSNALMDTCLPTPKNLQKDEDFDGWTSVLRNLSDYNPQNTVKLFPPPWSKEELAYCPSLSDPTKLKSNFIYWLPYQSLTKDFHAYHKMPGDCTHLISIPQFGTPLWDAMYWAVVRNNRLKTGKCEPKQLIPKYSSLLQFRKSNETLNGEVNDNFEDLFRDLELHSENAIPFILTRQVKT